MNEREIKNKPILDEINVLKGMAIIGILLMHMDIPLINSSFQKILMMTFVQFSWQIFMFVAGFLFGFSRFEISSFSNYIAFIVKKFKRLMVPYFVMSVIILLLKYFAAEFVTIKFPVDKDLWKYVIFNPIRGVTSFLWFLHMLFFVFMIFPILIKILRKHFVLFLMIFSINFVTIPDFFYFNHGLFRGFLVFFVIGYLYSHCKFETINMYSKYLFVLLLVLMMALFFKKGLIVGLLDNSVNNYLSINKLYNYIFVSLGIMTYYYLSVLMKNRKNPLSYVLKYVGTYSASIYLLHTISMGTVRIFSIDVLNLNENLYPLISILIFISGIIFPVLITKYIINKSEILSSLIIGVKKTP